MKKKMLTAVVLGTFSSGLISPIVSYAATNDLVTSEETKEEIIEEIESEDITTDTDIETSQTEEIIEIPDTTETSEVPVEENTTTSEAEEVSTEPSTETTSSSTGISSSTTESSTETIVSSESSEKEIVKPTKETTSTTTHISISEENQNNSTEIFENEQSAVDVSVVKNQSTEEFIESIGDKAREVGQEYDLYASVMIAQAILETGSGTSTLSQAPNHNLFGIKGAYKGQSANFYTNEDNGKGQLYTVQASFRKYPSYKESFEDYAELLTNTKTGNGTFYQGVLKKNAKTYQEATKYLTGRYATDTLYNQKLNKLIKTYDLTFFDKKLDKQGSIQAIYHNVEVTDTLDNLVTKYKVTKKELLSWNSISKEEDLLKQEKLIIGQEKVASYPIRNMKTNKVNNFIVPLKEGYTISSPFGARGAENHNGIDLAVAENTPIYASSKGKVVAKGFDPSAGNYIILEHDNGLKTSYFHLNRGAVTLNQSVDMGEMIGYVGSTGNSTGAHLHFAINTELWSGYMNPTNYLNFK